jgi:hypothetical protein
MKSTTRAEHHVTSCATKTVVANLWHAGKIQERKAKTKIFTGH